MKKVKSPKAFPPLDPSPLYTSVAKNVTGGIAVTVRNKKVVVYNGKKPGERIGVWVDPYEMVLILPDGREQCVSVPGGFQVRGPARMMMARSEDTYYGIPLEWDKNKKEK